MSESIPVCCFPWDHTHTSKAEAWHSLAYALTLLHSQGVSHVLSNSYMLEDCHAKWQPSAVPKWVLCRGLQVDGQIKVSYDCTDKLKEL